MERKRGIRTVPDINPSCRTPRREVHAALCDARVQNACMKRARFINEHIITSHIWVAGDPLAQKGCVCLECEIHAAHQGKGCMADDWDHHGSKTLRDYLWRYPSPNLVGKARKEKEKSGRMICGKKEENL